MLDLDSKSISLLHDDDIDEDDEDGHEEDLEDLCQPISLNFVSLSDIDAQITPLKAKAKGLQTIFEGVFLETPPRSGGRTVIPRKICDPSTGDSSSDDEDDQVTPLCDSYRRDLEEEEDLDGNQEIFMCSNIRRTPTTATTTTTTTSAIKEQLVVASRGEVGTVTAICNSFQRRLNLIPGEDC